MKKIIFFILFFVLALITPISYAQSPSIEDINEVLSRFKYYHEFNAINSSVPKVVEVLLDNNYQSYSDDKRFALLEVQTNTFQPYVITTKEEKTPYTVVSRLENGTNAEERALYDGKDTTSKEFPVLSTGLTKVTLQLQYTAPITTGNLILNIDRNGKLPVRIAVKADGYTVIADKTFYESDLQFPIYTAKNWEVTFSYDQPLRINEISFAEESSAVNRSRYVRFLMRPGFTYQLYADRDGYVDLPYLESGDLSSVTDVVSLSMPSAMTNTRYVPPDDDKDGKENASDNCPDVANPDQQDQDNNGKGDACEDFDQDGVMNSVDNCIDRPNLDQQDSDRDGKGDHCDDEESRLTERLAFLPWVGIALGFGIVIALFAATVKKTPKN